MDGESYQTMIVACVLGKAQGPACPTEVAEPRQHGAVLWSKNFGVWEQKSWFGGEEKTDKTSLIRSLLPLISCSSLEFSMPGRQPRNIHFRPDSWSFLLPRVTDKSPFEKHWITGKWMDYDLISQDCSLSCCCC